MPDPCFRRLGRAAVLSLLAVTLANTLGVPGAAAATAPFSLTPTVNPLTLQQNAGGTDTITVTNAAGFSVSVSLAVSGVPTGVSTAFAGNLLIVFPALSTPVGSYALTVTGTSGNTKETTTLTLVITPAATFTLAAAPASLSVTAGTSVTSTISIAPLAGFARNVSFAAAGLPAGATAAFAPANATSATTLTVATAASTPSGSYSLTVTGTAAATGSTSAFSETTTLTLIVAAAPAIAASGTTPVSLTGAFNAYGFFTDGTAVTNGGFDTAGNGFSANLLGSSVAWNGYVFPLGAANQPDSVANATVALPAGNYASLQLLASASYGPRTGTIVVTYTDGTTTTVTQTFSDWREGATFSTQSGESLALATAYSDSGSAGTATSVAGTTFNLYGYGVALNPDKVVASVTLPNTGYVRTFSMLLVSSPAHSTICQTQATTSYCTDQAPGAADASGYHDLVWVNLGKALTAIAVSDDQVWGLDAAQILWFLPNFKQGTTWIKVTSGVTQISAGHNLICQLSTIGHLLCASSANPQASAPDANGFQNVTWFDAGATNLNQIAVSAGKQIWGVDANSNVVRVTDYTNLAATTTLVGSGVSQVAVDGRGTVCQVNGNGNVYCSNWSVPAAVASPAPYHGLPWVNTGFALTHIAVADGVAWGVDASANVWQLSDYTNSSSWYRIANTGTTATRLAAASVASRFQAADFTAGDVAVLMIMGQSNSVGHDVIPARFISAASPNVWGIENGGWNFLPGNTNGGSPAFGGTIGSIGSVQWTNYALTPTGPDLNLGFNSNAGPGGNAANFAAYEWQGLVNAGWPLPDLYIIDIAWPSEGVDAADTTTAVAPWTTHGVNLWQPALSAAQAPSYALAPFARTIMYRGLQSLLRAGKTPHVLGLQWNQWEAEAGNSNPIVIAHAPANYTNLFGGFAAAIGSSFPIQFTKPLSPYYSTAVLGEMQNVFANLTAADPVNRSIIDISLFSTTIFSGGVYGGGDGAVHYNLDTQAWFGAQAVGACISQGNCGPRITSLPAAAPD